MAKETDYEQLRRFAEAMAERGPLSPLANIVDIGTLEAPKARFPDERGLFRKYVVDPILTGYAMKADPQTYKRAAEGVIDLAKLPGDVAAGRTDPLSEEGINRAVGLGLAMTLTPGRPGSPNTLGIGRGRRPGGSLYDFDYSVPKPRFGMTPQEIAAEKGVGITRGPEVIDVSAPAALKAAGVPNLRNMPVDEATAIAATEPHTKLPPGPKGNIAGAPDWVRTPKDLAKMRADVDSLMLGGVADPAIANITGWDWYHRARRQGLEQSGSPMAAVFSARLGGEFSPNATPESETGYTLRERNAALVNPPQIKLDEAGNPVMWRDTKGKLTNEPTYEGGFRAGRPQQHQDFMRALMMQDPLEMARGKKTSEYATKQGPEGLASANTATGVNDFRMQQIFGYKGPKGEPVKSSEASARGEATHRFMDYETALAVKRANEMNLGGKSDWTGEEMQAMLWTRNKAADLAKKSKGRFTYDEALRIAASQPFDYQGKHTAYATHEQMPGVPRPFTDTLLGASKEVQDQFSLDPRSTWRGPGGRDALYGGLRIGETPVGMMVAPSTPMQGVWQGEGGLQFNRGEVARPQVGLVKGGMMDPASRSILEGGELTRAYIDAQQAGAAHVLFPKVKAGQMGSVDIPMKRSLTPAEADQLLTVAKQHGFGDISDRGTGVTMTNFGAPPEGARVGRMLADPEGFRGKLEKLLPEAGVPRRVAVDSIYAGFNDTWSKAGSGEATRYLLNELDKAPGVRNALDRNNGIAMKALGNMARDEEFAKSLGVSAPRDIQNAREIISAGPGWVGRLRKALADGAVLPVIAGPLLATAMQSEGGSSPQ